MLMKIVFVLMMAGWAGMAGLGYLIQQAWVANGEQKAQIEGLQESARMASKAAARNRAISGRLQARKAALGRSEALAGHSLEAATRANPEWADQPLPQEVQDALK
jgi:hypothetical protein